MTTEKVGSSSTTRRKPLELRPIKMEQRLLAHQDGSGLFTFGQVSALAAITGPSEVRIRDERTDRAALQVHYTPLQGVAGTTAIAFEQALLGIWTYALQLHLYPRALIQIHLQTYTSPAMLSPRPILHVNGDERGTAQTIAPTAPPEQVPHPDAPISVAVQAAHINATTLACLDAATNMRCLVASASAAVLRKGVRENRMRGWRAGEQASSALSTVQDARVTDAPKQAGNSDDDEDQDDSDAFEIILDPSAYEESLARSTHIFAFAFELLPTVSSSDSTTLEMQTDDAQQFENETSARLQANMLYNQSHGPQRGNEYFDCLALCRQASQNIALQMRSNMQA